MIDETEQTPDVPGTEEAKPDTAVVEATVVEAPLETPAA